ncbi:hypothetical protein [Streptomyces sp. URMC 125]|uniref:hypothetical protein n=1 Tax=Streptomyces sp. URMC 125 TaxID=3423419 RepID=UPI003F1AC2B7
MVDDIPAAVLLAVLALLLVNKSGLKAGRAVVCALPGFHLTDPSIAPKVSDSTTSATRTVSGIRFRPGHRRR